MNNVSPSISDSIFILFIICGQLDETTEGCEKYFMGEILYVYTPCKLNDGFITDDSTINYH